MKLPDLDGVRERAPSLCDLLEDFDDRGYDVAEAIDELVALADDRRVSAAEAAVILGYKHAPNANDALKELAPSEILTRGRLYRARDVERLAAERDEARREREARRRPRKSQEQMEIGG